MHRPCGILCLVATLCLAMGCGPSRPKTYPVSGTVSFDGKPVPEGDIILRAADGHSAPAAGKIKDGEFHLEATAGQKKVEIRAAHKVARVEGAMGDEYQDYLPPEYNSKTTLTAEVKEQGENHFDFPLESPKEP